MPHADQARESANRLSEPWSCPEPNCDEEEITWFPSINRHTSEKHGWVYMDGPGSRRVKYVPEEERRDDASEAEFETVTDVLHRFGLNDYQSRAYEALLEHGLSEAGTISTIAQVPRTKIYSVLEDLEEKGLVSVVPGRPKQYLPVSSDTFLDREAAHHEAVLDDVDQARALFDKKLPTTPREVSSDVDNREITGRKPIMGHIPDLLDDAETRIVLSATAGAARRFAYHSMSFEQVPSHVPIHAYLPPDAADQHDPVKDLINVTLPHDRAPVLDSTFLIVDDSVLLWHARPDDTRLFDGDDTALITTNHGLAHDLAHLAATTSPHPLPNDLHGTQ